MPMTSQPQRPLMWLNQIEISLQNRLKSVNEFKYDWCGGVSNECLRTKLKIFHKVKLIHSPLFISLIYNNVIFKVWPIEPCRNTITNLCTTYFHLWRSLKNLKKYKKLIQDFVWQKIKLLLWMKLKLLNWFSSAGQSRAGNGRKWFAWSPWPTWLCLIVDLLCYQQILRNPGGFIVCRQILRNPDFSLIVTPMSTISNKIIFVSLQKVYFPMKMFDRSSSSAFDRTAGAGVLWEKNLLVIFLGRGSPSAFNRIARAEDSPFQKTRLFGKYSITL